MAQEELDPPMEGFECSISWHNTVIKNAKINKHVQTTYNQHAPSEASSKMPRTSIYTLLPMSMCAFRQFQTGKKPTMVGFSPTESTPLGDDLTAARTSLHRSGSSG